MEDRTKDIVMDKTSKMKVDNTKLVMSQDEFLEAKMLEMMEAKLQQLEANEVTLGVKVIKLTELEGKDKVDQHGNPIIKNPETGEVEKWAPSYYATVTFNGGELQQRVTKEQYSELQTEKRFVAKGRLVLVTPEKGFPYMKPEFTGFHRIF
jgi:hypothetical protein